MYPVPRSKKSRRATPYLERSYEADYKRNRRPTAPWVYQRSRGVSGAYGNSRRVDRIAGLAAEISDVPLFRSKAYGEVTGMLPSPIRAACDRVAEGDKATLGKTGNKQERVLQAIEVRRLRSCRRQVDRLPLLAHEISVPFSAPVRNYVVRFHVSADHRVPFKAVCVKVPPASPGHNGVTHRARRKQKPPKTTPHEN
jgi:hypothetical protein